MENFKTVEQYFQSIPQSAQAPIRTLWKVIRSLVPKGEEAMRYGMPTIRLYDKNLLHAALMKNHIGFYPTPSGIKAFEKEIAKKYKYSKGAIQFPLEKKLPIVLIKKIIKFRLAEENSRVRI